MTTFFAATDANENLIPDSWESFEARAKFVLERLLPTVTKLAAYFVTFVAVAGDPRKLLLII